ncbi:T-cell antigen CD7 [Ursus americanus]|uniref:Ig-like domain-containing protein n=1 Tax=Ursus americanus TaxID=9643 RepID=A0A452R7N8_URSAM|nr:T-cell antigen CD7 [Ursus americanus]
MAPELPLLSVLLTLTCTLLRAPATQELWQSPPYTVAPEGGSINITCSTSRPLSGVYLKQRWPKPTSVIYYEDKKQPTVDEHFRGRIGFSGLQHNLTVTLSHLRLSDTGVYACQAVMDDVVWGPGTLVVVTDKVSQEVDSCQKAQLASALPVVLAVSCFFLGLGIGAVCVLRKTQVKKLCCTKDKNSACVVYEDMSYRSQNRMSTPNEYQ